jgi:hypothetical protein
MTMAKLSILTLKQALTRMTASRHGLMAGTAFISALVLAGCAVEWQNRQAAQEVAELSKPPGSIYMGWRVFQDRCASCHGSDASGTANAPNLLLRVRDMSSRQFVSLVLQRYDLNSQTIKPGSGSAAGEAQIETMMQRKDAPLNMPAWQGEPRVNAHIVDLYAYLSARAEGTQGPGRPTP